MNSSLVLLASVALIGALASGAANASVNLVQNGGFETGDLTSWNNDGWFTANSIAGVSAYDGTYFATTGCVEQYCTLDQTLATTPGGTYTLTFSFNPGIYAAPGQTDTYVTWGGATVLDVGQGPAAWTTYTLTGLVASGSSTDLAFVGYQNPAYNGVDDVSVSGASGVPEPASWAMMLVGFGLAGAALRRRGAAVI